MLWSLSCRLPPDPPPPQLSDQPSVSVCICSRCIQKHKCVCMCGSVYGGGWVCVCVCTLLGVHIAISSNICSQYLETLPFILHPASYSRYVMMSSLRTHQGGSWGAHVVSGLCWKGSTVEPCYMKYWRCYGQIYCSRHTTLRSNNTKGSFTFREIVSKCWHVKF